jgi:uncharacterized protein YutD
MFLAPKRHMWYWYAFGALMACFILYGCARFFLRSMQKVEKKQATQNATRRKKQREVWEEMFI